MEIWIIAVIAAGGVVLLALLALTIYKCCCQRRNRKNKDVTGQNGHVWQAHDKDVELADEEDPQGNLREDGLCRDTEAGSTFPRRVKAESPNSGPQKKDGLCEDTEKRFTYPRRVRPENELLLPADDKSLSTSETGLKSVVPLGFSVITRFDEKDVKDKELIKSEVQVHSAERGSPKEKVKDKDSSSDSSSDSDSDEKQQNGAKHLIKSSEKKGERENGKRVRSFVHRTRSKSFHNSVGDVPEYSKPMKRSVSNPSVLAREEMIQRDERFRSLEVWRATIPIPEPDYPNDISSARLKEEEDDQDNAPPSYATSDSGVECFDALSGQDDESINHSDSIPESPGLPSQLKHENSFSSFKETSYKERTEMRFQKSNHTLHTDGPDYGINGFQDNALVVTSKDHTALIDIDANAAKDSPSPFGVNQHSLFCHQSTPMDNKPRDTDPKPALRSTTKPVSNSVSSSERKPTERIQTKHSEQIDFRSVKLRPTSKNYEENHSFMIYGSNTAVLPSSEKKEEQPTTLDQHKPKNQDLPSPLSSGTTIVINNATDEAKDRYILPKTHTIEAEKNATKIKSLDTNKGNDFQRIHLRQTPQSVKQHIGFREDMMSQAFKDAGTREENTTSDKTQKGSESVIGVLDGIKRFQSQGAQVPKPMYGSHYVSKNEPNPTKPASIISQEPTPNSKPVSIVAPEPSTMARETTHKTTTTTLRNTRDVVVTKNENVHKNERTRPMSVIKDPVVSEDKRQNRYSTGNIHQSHVSLGFKDAPKKPITIIRGLDEEEDTNTTSNNQDSLEKPVAVVPPQSPKAKRETAEERAAFEEERKKNWKREQIEQKLTSAHIRSVQNNKDQILPASGLAYRSCMPELFDKINQIGKEKEEASVQ